MSTDQADFTEARKNREAAKIACSREYWALRRHHPEVFRRNLEDAYARKYNIARGIGTEPGSRVRAVAMESRVVEVRSTGMQGEGM